VESHGSRFNYGNFRKQPRAYHKTEIFDVPKTIHGKHDAVTATFLDSLGAHYIFTSLSMSLVTVTMVTLTRGRMHPSHQLLAIPHVCWFTVPGNLINGYALGILEFF
jgi:hypothetical protein